MLTAPRLPGELCQTREAQLAESQQRAASLELRLASELQRAAQLEAQVLELERREQALCQSQRLRWAPLPPNIGWDDRRGWMQGFSTWGAHGVRFQGATAVSSGEAMGVTVSAQKLTADLDWDGAGLTGRVECGHRSSLCTHAPSKMPHTTVCSAGVVLAAAAALCLGQWV